MSAAQSLRARSTVRPIGEDLTARAERSPYLHRNSFGSTPASQNARSPQRVQSCGVNLRCVIVDDNAAFLQVAQELLEREDFDVVGLANTSAEAIALVQDLEPDVVLVDFYLGKENGLDLVGVLSERAGSLGPSIILISTYANDDLAELTATGPGVGFLTKGELSGVSIRSLLASS